MTEEDIQRALAGLEQIGVDQSGWFELYRDPGDGQLWEISYPQGEL